jgi:hypothetical protein
MGIRTFFITPWGHDHGSLNLEQKVLRLLALIKKLVVREAVRLFIPRPI